MQDIIVLSGMTNSTWKPIFSPRDDIHSVGILNTDGSAALLFATDTSSAAASIKGTVPGIYNIIALTNAAVTINPDGGGNQAISLAAGVGLTAAQIVADLNSKLTGVTASVDGSCIRLTSNTVGASSSVQIVTVSASAYTSLGFVAGTTTGTASTSVSIASGLTHIISGSQGARGYGRNEIIGYVQGSGAQPTLIFTV